MLRRVLAFLRSQNTHFAWWAGVVGISLSLFVVLGGKDAAETWSSAHLDGVGRVCNFMLEGIAQFALWCWFPSIVAGLVGRPPFIPQHGGPFVAKDVK